MILLELFLTFLKIGAVSFGGGYAMISFIREQALLHGWLTESELLNLIAVAESTPGPIAVNMATFVGSTQGGIIGSLVATAGIVLPSFIIILIVAALVNNLLKFGSVQAFLKGIRPCVVGLIISTAITMLLSNLFGIKTFASPVSVDLSELIIFCILIALALLWERIKKKKPSPIIMILISAGLGLIVCPLFE